MNRSRQWQFYPILFIFALVYISASSSPVFAQQGEGISLEIEGLVEVGIWRCETEQGIFVTLDVREGSEGDIVQRVVLGWDGLPVPLVTPTDLASLPESTRIWRTEDVSSGGEILAVVDGDVLRFVSTGGQHRDLPVFKIVEHEEGGHKAVDPEEERES